MSYLVLSLFPGIGLLDMAFEQEGFCVVRGPDVLWGGDVRAFHPPPGRFDGVIGGPPCQAFSQLRHLVEANGNTPKFGNLIPEFERVVAEAGPRWFLMENVHAAPVPVVAGYGVKSFLLDNSMLNAGDGWGLEQRRVRRFSFGLRGVAVPPSLMRWIDLATFVLPDASPATTSAGSPIDNSKKAKTRVPAVTGGHSDPNVSMPEMRRRKKALFGDGRPTRQEERRTGIAAVGHGEPTGVREGKRSRGAVRTGDSTSSDGGTSVRMSRYRLAEALRLQGLPEGFLADAPFTVEGKLKAIANGVPIPMGRAIARAIIEALK